MKYLESFNYYTTGISEELSFACKMGLLNSFRPQTEKFFQVICEARNKKSLLNLSENDKSILNTDIGKKGFFRGIEVPLDLPMSDIQHKKFESLFEEKNSFDIEQEIKLGDVVSDGQGDKYKVISVSTSSVKLTPLTFVGPPSYFPTSFGDGTKIDEFWQHFDIEEKISEAKYRGREVELEKPKRGGPKKYYVYVKNPKTDRINKVTFGAKDGGQDLRVKLDDPEARKNYSKRHGCEDSKHDDKLKPGYWSCRLPRYWHIINPDQEKMDALWW